MDIRPLTDRYAVSPQIDPEDVSAIAEAGFTTIINNRPCSEVPPSHQADAMGEAVRAAGLDYVVLPVTHDMLGPEIAARQSAACDAATGPVLAYCASGTRSTYVWAIGQAGNMAADDIIAAAASQGYDLRGFKSTLDSLAGQ